MLTPKQQAEKMAAREAARIASITATPGSVKWQKAVESGEVPLTDKPFAGLRNVLKSIGDPNA